MTFQDDLEKLQELIRQPLSTLEEVEAIARRLEDTIEDGNPSVANELMDLCEQSLAEVNRASNQIQGITRKWGYASSPDYVSKPGEENDPKTKEKKSLSQNYVSKSGEENDPKTKERKSIEYVRLDEIFYSQGHISEEMSDGEPVSEEMSDGEPTKKKSISIYEVAEKMKTKGWDKNKPLPDMVRFRDEKTGGTRIVTLDNRRIVAAKLAGLKKVPANIHDANDRFIPEKSADRTLMLVIWRLLLKTSSKVLVILLKNFLSRFKLKNDLKTKKTYYKSGSQPETWGEAAMFRAANQREKGHKGFPLCGSQDVPEIRSKKDGNESQDVPEIKKDGKEGNPNK